MATGDAVQALQAALVEARATIAAQQTTIAQLEATIAQLTGTPRPGGGAEDAPSGVGEGKPAGARAHGAA